MLISLLNFVWFFTAAFVIGTFISFQIFKLCKVQDVYDRNISLDIIIVVGIISLIVYSQIFSLFYKVGILANVFLLLICIFLHFKNHYHISYKYFKGKIFHNIFNLIVLVFITIIFLIISSNVPNSADDYGYHNQAVRWIEDYGVVKGLGNFHNRFAYNSSFLCLSALFSFRDLPFVGKSLHGINAFSTAIFVIYCFFSLHLNIKSKALCSDVMKIFGIMFVFRNCQYWSGLSTDAMAQILIIYIFIKWLEFTEAKKVPIIMYAILCTFAICSITLKLSAGLVGLLTLYPLYKLLKDKDYKAIIVFLILYIVILLPYIIRNVIISGYLLYPMENLDLFNVPWKMSKDVILNDRAGMIIWGRGLNYHFPNMSYLQRMNINILTWFPHWLNTLSIFNRVITISAFLSAFIYIFMFIGKIVHKDIFSLYDFIFFIAITCFTFWLLSAPLIRYGEIYIVILLSLFIGLYFKDFFVKITICLLAFLIIFFVNRVIRMTTSTVKYIYPSDYYVFKMHENYIPTKSGNSIKIYYPENDEKLDYWHFPSVCKKNDIPHIGMLGETFKDGFYIKD